LIQQTLVPRPRLVGPQPTLAAAASLAVTPSGHACKQLTA